MYTGVTIIIPTGAIPEGIQQDVYFKVCQDNSIVPPLDAEKGRLFMILNTEYFIKNTQQTCMVQSRVKTWLLIPQFCH